jgi:hypothetical protein
LTASSWYVNNPFEELVSVKKVECMKDVDNQKKFAVVYGNNKGSIHAINGA